jgi:hypothetical protein
MAVKVCFTLRRNLASRPAIALFLPPQRAGDLLRICAEVGLRSVPEVYSCGDGLLVKLPDAIKSPVALATGLQNVAGNFYLPANASLIPPLFEDEAKSLTRDRGLLFLPGNRILEFDHRQPLPSGVFLSTTVIPRRTWVPLDATTGLAERVTELAVQAPDIPVEKILEEGGAGIGTETPRPDEGSLAGKIVGRGALGIGMALGKLGNLLHWKALSRLGAGGIHKALALAPRLTESLLGKQEAALRALLRDFRDGNIERALRRALPLTTDIGRGATPAASAHLPERGFLYSLAAILGSGRGGTYYWLTPFDIRAQLEREYRAQAEKATQRGDYRRAAFIYAKLLSDYAMAARVLEKGGLFLDAAAIYLKKLHDERSAARAYEAAGAIDRALKIYRRLGDYESAGDLLRRLGDDEAALAEYEKAARQLIDRGAGHHQAGDLLLKKAKRPDLASHYYRLGWAARPLGSPIPCALRLAEMAGREPGTENLFVLLSEAEEYLASSGADSEAADFFNAIARLADQPHLVDCRDDLRDRALVALAARLRQRARDRMPGPNLISTFLGQSWWPPALSSDAAFAVKAATRAISTARPTGTATIVVHSAERTVVTAACSAPDTGELFIGFARGDVSCYRAERGELRQILASAAKSLTVDELNRDRQGDQIPYPGAVSALATSPQGGTLLVLRENGSGKPSLISFKKDAFAAYSRIDECEVDVSAEAGMTAMFGVPKYAIWDENQLLWISGASPPVIENTVAWSSSDRGRLEAGLVLPSAGRRELPARVLLLGDNKIWNFAEYLHRIPPPHRIGWTPDVPEGSGLRQPVVSWVNADLDKVEFAGISQEGSVYWSKLCLKHDAVIATNVAADARYRAATIIRPGLVAAVTDDAVLWIQCGKTTLTRCAKVNAPFANTVACFAHAKTEQLLLLSSNGSIACLPFGKLPAGSLLAN